MKKVITNYTHASTIVNNPMIEYSKAESFQRRMYLLLLKVNEESIRRLEGKSRINAYFNEFTTFYIIEAIRSTIREDKDLALLMMKKETNRIQNVINSYKNGEVEKYSMDEMKDILSIYMDEESVNNAVRNLYRKDKNNSTVKSVIK